MSAGRTLRDADLKQYDEVYIGEPAMVNYEVDRRRNRLPILDCHTLRSM